jgi:hypothetical protein
MEGIDNLDRSFKYSSQREYVDSRISVISDIKLILINAYIQGKLKFSGALAMAAQDLCEIALHIQLVDFVGGLITDKNIIIGQAEPMRHLQEETILFHLIIRRE